MMFSYHDIVALHLCLLIGQFVILHLKTEMTDNVCFCFFLRSLNLFNRTAMFS